MRRLVSLLLLTATACSSDARKEPPVAPPVFTCNNDPLCAAMAGTALVIGAAMSPHTAAERRMRSNQISGTCEVHGLNVPDPCGTILLTITDAKGIERKAWVVDREFQVNNLGQGPFTVLAESEAWGLSSKVENVKIGSTIEIQLRRSAHPK